MHDKFIQEMGLVKNTFDKLKGILESKLTDYNAANARMDLEVERGKRGPQAAGGKNTDREIAKMGCK